jgi:stage II sporulation protein AA (anti-sigma F factor antagonist)
MPESKFAHISCRKESGILVILLEERRIQGDDLGDAIRQELLAAVQQHNASNVAIDFGKVEYLSTAGFRPLLSLHRKLSESRGRMIFFNLAPETEEVFTVTRLISPSRSSPSPFESAPDLAAALARFRHHTSRVEHGVLVLTLTDDKLLGDDLADSLAEQLLATVSESAVMKVALDFQPVEAIATACLRPILSLRNHLHAKGGRLMLCNLQPRVVEVLTVTRLIASAGAGPVPLESARDLAAAIATLNASS